MHFDRNLPIDRVGFAQHDAAVSGSLGRILEQICNHAFNEILVRDCGYLSFKASVVRDLGMAVL